MAEHDLKVDATSYHRIKRGSLEIEVEQNHIVYNVGDKVVFRLNGRRRLDFVSKPLTRYINRLTKVSRLDDDQKSIVIDLVFTEPNNK